MDLFTRRAHEVEECEDDIHSLVIYGFYDVSIHSLPDIAIGAKFDLDYFQINASMRLDSTANVFLVHRVYQNLLMSYTLHIPYPWPRIQ